MSDRELLEDAAKAAGFEAYWSDSLEDWQKDLTDPYVNKKKWHPLTDDGDALRLAVKLNLHISVFVDAIGVGTPGAGYDEFKYEGDPYAATRRAIVRAAAKIGRSKE